MWKSIQEILKLFWENISNINALISVISIVVVGFIGRGILVCIQLRNQYKYQSYSMNENENRL